jgi:hypothetical protein
MSPVLPAARPALVERFARERPHALLWDAERSLVLDVFSGKALHLPFDHIDTLEERTDAATGRPYLLLALDGDRQVVLTDAGVAFPPRTGATGPLPDLPAAVCFRDLAGAEGKLTHFLLDHPDEEPNRSHVTLFLFCLAVVDGARAAGFEVGSEERRLERLLDELDARRRAGG